MNQYLGLKVAVGVVALSASAAIAATGIDANAAGSGSAAGAARKASPTAAVLSHAQAPISRDLAAKAMSAMKAALIRSGAPVVGRPSMTSMASRHIAKTDRNASSSTPPPAAITVRGNWVNDLSCVPPTAPSTDGKSIILDCDGSSPWGGDFTGQEQARIHAVVDSAGNVVGDYVAEMIGVYLGDNSHGALIEKGHFVATGTTFSDEASFKGNCDWVDSWGTIDFTGISLNGGYVGQWFRPTRPAAGPTCDPFDPKPFLP